MPIGDKFDSVVLSQIKEKHIKPTSRWIFVFKDAAIWALGVLLLLLGAAAFSVILYLIQNNDWDIYEEFSGNLLGFIVLTLPYFWIVFLALFILVINYDIKHTKNGYKYSASSIVMVSIMCSILLGGLLFNAGLGQALDDILGQEVVFYDQIINPRIHMWDAPDQGKLSGMIIAQLNQDQYEMVDISHNEWLIDASQIQSPGGEIIIQIGRPVRLLGKRDGTSSFIAKKVINHDGPGRGMMANKLRDKMMPPPPSPKEPSCPPPGVKPTTTCQVKIMKMATSSAVSK